MTARRAQIMNWLKDTLAENLPEVTYRAFIFGSQANCDELIRSDIDVGILADAEIPAVNLFKINNAIENLPMLYKIDLVDFYWVSDRFKEVALSNVEWL